MALQKTVRSVPALGIAGQQVVPRQAVYLTYNPLSDGTVKAGAFCFGKVGSGNGEVFGQASGTGTTVLGFVEHVADTAIVNYLADAQGVYPAGSAVTVAIRGQYYIEAVDTATDGKKVLVKQADGSISFGDSALEGQTDTGWVVRIPNGGSTAAKGDIVIIERV